MAASGIRAVSASANPTLATTPPRVRRRPYAPPPASSSETPRRTDDRRFPIVEKDTVALRQVPKVGKKLAETIVLELSDKVDDLIGLTVSEGGAPTGAAQQAVQALVSLGYSFNDADRAVRDVLETGAPESTEELIRRALAGRAARFSG